MKRFGVEGGTKKSCPKGSRRVRGGQLGLKMLSICDRALDSRDKKREEEFSKGELLEDETLGELKIHFDPLQCREGDCTTTLRWLVVGAVSISLLLSFSLAFSSCT